MTCLYKVIAYAKETGFEASTQYLARIARQLDALQAESMTPSEFAGKVQMVFDVQLKVEARNLKMKRAINLGIREKNFADVQTNVKENGFSHYEAVRSVFDGSAVQPGVGVRNSPLTLRNVLKGYYRNALKDMGSIYDEVLTGVHDLDILKALDRLQRGQSTKEIQNPTAIKAAEVIYGVQNDILNRKKAVDPDIGKIDGYLVAQMHQRERFGSTPADQARWVAKANKVYGKLSFPEMTAEEKIVQFASIWERVRSGTYGYLKEDGSSAFGKEFLGEVGTGDIMTRMSKERVLISESPELTYEYNKEFGYGTILETVEKMGDNAARDISRLEKFTSKPAEFAKGLIDRVYNSIKDPQTKAEFKAQVPALRKSFNAAMGSADAPAINTSAKVVNGITAFTAATKIGLAWPRSFQDLAISAGKIHDLDGNTVIGNAFHFSVAYAKSMISSSYRNEALSDMSMFTKTTARSLYEDMGASDQGKPGMITKMADAMGSLSMIKRHVDAMKASMAVVLGNKLNRISGMEWSALPETWKQGFTNYRITENMWNFIRQASQDYGEHASKFFPDGAKFMTPEAVSALPDVLTENFARKEGLIAPGREATPELLNRARSQAAEALATMVNDHATMGSVHPNLRQQTFMHQGMSINDHWGQFFRLALQFKSASLSSFDSYRKGYYSQGGGLRGAMFGVASTATMALFFNTMGEYLIDAAGGKTPQDPTDPKFIAKMVLMSGFAGPAGDMLSNAMDAHGARDMSLEIGKSALGPNFGALADVAGLGLAAAGYGLGYKEGSPGVDAAKFIKRQIPFQNLIWTKMLTDHYYNTAIEAFLKDGYLNDLQRNVSRNSGLMDEKQQYFVGP